MVFRGLPRACWEFLFFIARTVRNFVRASASTCHRLRAPTLHTWASAPPLRICRQSWRGCVERTAGHASVWIATSFAWGCSCTRSVSSTQPAASHNSPSVCNCLTVADQRHSEAAPHRAFMGIKWCPVERPVEHTCAATSRAPRNWLLGCLP